MGGIIIVSDNKTSIEAAGVILGRHSLSVSAAGNAGEAENLINNGALDIVLYDCCSENIDIPLLAGKMKFLLQTKDVRSILLLPEKDINYSLLKYTDGFISRPFDENLFYAAVKSNLQIRESLMHLSKNSGDLAKSLYQLNSLYTAGAQLAGELDKTKLIDITLEGLEQSLSSSLCYAMILNDANDIKLIIKSVFPVSQRLENAVKLRALLNYKNLFSINPDINDIVISKFSKKQFDTSDLNIFGFDNLSAPVNINNKFYGIIEAFRDTDFSQEDAKCFSALVKQVIMPLQSAILYDEIKSANIKLKELEHLKSEFISIVSHELKTPLTSINSALDIILGGSTGAVNDAAVKFLNLAKRNASRLSAIIYDLLDLSKIEAGKMDFHFAKTNINLTAELVKNSLENPAKERNITIKLNLDKSIDNVYIDSQRIEQVLSNLISNAVKFTPENGVIEVSSTRIPAEKIRNNSFFTALPEHLSLEYAQISVKDNGIGIAKENWHKVFEQFKQIENPLIRKSGGSGLGLPIAKRLIDAHKGFIWLESELNKGSAFYIAIPIMNDREIFELSLGQEMLKAKQDKINIALFALSENIVEGKSLIDKILSEEIIRRTSAYNYYSIIKEGRRYYYCYAADVEYCVYVFELRRLETYIKEHNEEYRECGIMYSSALYPENGSSIEDLTEKLNRFTAAEKD